MKIYKNIFKLNSNNKQNIIYISGLHLTIETIVIDIKSYHICDIVGVINNFNGLKVKISDNVPYNLEIVNINEEI
ncbi:hypothetical protein FG379_001963 [Cryptosporidium bovis]|uniref:uncharacterized protein n=1 Tax=Cryptosporidium bovis TaxID=310047 RepID=UPI00351A58CD|nr:hypothetical protein FG379_001963 [Cryptosporidium bovis]